MTDIIPVVKCDSLYYYKAFFFLLFLSLGYYLKTHSWFNLFFEIGYCPWSSFSLQVNLTVAFKLGKK